MIVTIAIRQSPPKIVAQLFRKGVEIRCFRDKNARTREIYAARRP